MAAKSIAFLVLLSVFPAAYAATLTVGNGNGWISTGVNYTNWASSQSFAVGDTLVFNFGSGHSVAEVTSPNYESCTATGAISSSTTSPTNITLNTTDSRYFICGAPGHCTSGQKLAVVGVSAGSTATPPTGTAPSPAGSSVPSTPAADTPPSATSPPGAPPSAATTLVGGQFVLPLVLAAMVGVMG